MAHLESLVDGLNRLSFASGVFLLRMDIFNFILNNDIELMQYRGKKNLNLTNKIFKLSLNIQIAPLTVCGFDPQRHF